MKNLPFVSVALPVRNEEEYIEEALMSLINQDYPKNKYEIIIADGMSTDRTVEIIKKIKRKYKRPKIRIYENRKITTASGFNLCVKKSKSKYIVRFMGHALAQKNFIKETVLKLLQEPKSTIMVSCINSVANKGGVGRLSGLAMKSFLGGTSSCYRIKKGYIYDYSGGFGAIRKKLFKEIGLIDEKIKCGDDAYFNLKSKLNNYNVLISPKTEVKIFKRKSIKKFVKQMFEFGKARMELIKKFPSSFKMLYLAPLLFFIYMLGVPLAFLYKLNWYYWPLFLYTILNMISSIEVSEKITDIIPIFFLTFVLHLSYGAGEFLEILNSSDF
ncbi:MAG: glycosyltransferase [Candidatus Aenigmarchaeota archaeon]|nr:glycosyltransferase [Candidatus Aenigmarchaeota archaeon]